MFTGIVEEVGKITAVDSMGDNLTFTVRCNFTGELKIDQSVAHNGVCLTVIELNKGENTYKVTAVKETLLKSNLGDLRPGMTVNLERAMKLNDRIDGHLVQGHVDCKIECIDKKELNGSWIFTFSLNEDDGLLMVEKGSVTINGVSLTVFDVSEHRFSVTIIPYTYEHTTFQQLNVNDLVNVEFDIVGKYVNKQLGVFKKQL